MNLLGALFIVAVLFVTSAYAGPLEDGEAAFKREEYTTALKILRPLAEQGDPEAQWIVGGLFISGDGVPEDLKEAEKWWRKSADQGHVEAQYFLGI